MKASAEGKHDRASYEAARGDAIIRFDELMLLAPPPVNELVGDAMKRLDGYWQENCDEAALLDAAGSLFDSLRADLDEMQRDAASGGPRLDR